MKNKIFIILVILVLLASIPLNVSAQTGSPTPTPGGPGLPTVAGDTATVTFAQLGFRNDTLSSPYDTTRLLFSVPPNWRLKLGAQVVIDYEIVFSGTDIAKLVNGTNPFGGVVTISFNKKIIGTIPLDKAGSNTVQFQLPADSLAVVREDGRHQLNFTLNTQFTCYYDLRAKVTIKTSSLFVLPFDISAPVLDLGKLPAPFHLDNAMLPEHTVVAYPDSATTGEVQSALNIMAGFGSMIGDTTDFNMVNSGALSEDDLKSNNLIFVGKPGGFNLLSKVNFPLAVANGNFTNLPATSANDGVLQMAPSPWNPDKVVMLVSGNSDDAVARAAFAASSGRVFTYGNPTLSYVSNVQLLGKTIPTVEDFTLKQLGYQTVTSSGVGLLSVDYVFSVSNSQVTSKDGYIDLVYYHSGLLDYGQSSLSVSLNNQVINGTAFTKDTEKLSTLRISIPTGLLRFGQNHLVVGARMLIFDFCDTSGFSTPWLTISDQTLIHIPVGQAPGLVSQSALDLKSFPSLFTTHSDLGDLGFVLAKANNDSFIIAGKLAYNFGVVASPGLPNIAAAFADAVPDDIKNNRSMIVIGKASVLPFVKEINDRLPAPFDFNDNTASEKNMQISYRIPAGVSVGYVELAGSPYNPAKSILVLAGNTDQGVNMAGDALLVPDLAYQLAGLFAVSNGKKIATSVTPTDFSVVGKAVPEAVPTVNLPLIPTPAAGIKSALPAWLLPFLGFSVLAIVVILIYVLATALMRRRSPKNENPPD